MSEEKKPYSILFIEDEIETRKNYVEYLKRYFNGVHEASDGEEGFQTYQNKQPNIMIVDINIPKKNGLELVEKIRKNDFKTKIIMLTAHSQTKYLLKATELKLTKYLIKPISRKELRHALDLAIKELSTFDIKQKKIFLLKNNFYWDYDSKELFKNSSSITLTNKEQHLLELLFSNTTITHKYDDIIFAVWYENYNYHTKMDALKTIIKNLRKNYQKILYKIFLE